VLGWDTLKGTSRFMLLEALREEAAAWPGLPAKRVRLPQNLRNRPRSWPWERAASLSCPTL
jgi:hypothetical protein